MDTFTVMVGATTLAMVYYGERFKSGAYLLLASIYAILFAWRMGEEMFYIGSGALIFVLVYRTFYADSDARDDSGDFDNDD